ncbi:MAG: VCBS repeat-containing protein [Myxococcales bacterium]
MSKGWLLALSALALLGGGCTAFPDIPTGVCGNGVIDPGEDCDSFADTKTPGSSCLAKGAVGECHFDCSSNGGKAPACPSGWGCDSAAICRRPTGDFLPPAQVGDVGAWSLSAADFDGDGREDVLSSEPLDGIGATRIKFFYFDQRGELADTRSFPKLIFSPTIGQFAGDAPHSDLAFSNSALGVMLGRSDRTWLPETFSSYRIDDMSVRVAAIADPRFGAPTSFLSLLSPATRQSPSPGSGLYVIDQITGQLRAQAHVAWVIDDLVGDLVSGPVFEDKLESPCLEPVFALKNQRRFSILNVCRFDSKRNETGYREPLEETDIALDPPAIVDSAPLIADMNGDGHLDILIDAGGRPYVSYGDGLTLSVATPYQLLRQNEDEIPADIPMPIAAGDFTGDGAPDFVFSDRLMVSSKVQGADLPVYVDQLRNRLGGPITSAKIADFNGNGALDVAVASNQSLNVALYSGAPGPTFATSIISTSAPVQSLATGDFDGDLTQDLAVLEEPRVGETVNTLKIAYGTAFGALLPLSPVARLNHVEQLAYVDSGGIGGIALTSSDPIAGHSSGAVTLMNGSPDRIPFAPFALTDFSATRSVLDSVAYSLAVGRFTQGSSGDLIALAFPNPTPKSDEVTPMNLWLLANVRSAGAESKRLPAELDPRLKPVAFLDHNSDFTSDAASASADLDGDGLDEAIFVMPAGDQQTECGVLTIGANGSVGAAVAPRDPVVFAEHCEDPVVVPVDADGDGFPDLAVLTGRTNDPDRKLLIFWNDGAGSFSEASFSLVSSVEDSPQAFSVLPQSKEQALALVYVTANEVRRSFAAGSPRSFSAPATLYGGLTGISGVTAADVNGDHVKDIVLAQSGRLSVLKAQLGQ